MKWFFCLSLALASCFAVAHDTNWLIHGQMPLAYETILKAISPEGGAKGAIFASPQREDPNYFYHWVRDAGLITEGLMSYYDNFATPAEKPVIFQKLLEHFEFNEKIQRELVKALGNPVLTELGEPKTKMDGEPFDGPWGRPQSDGPALRIISMIHFAKILKAENLFETYRTRLYDGRIPAESVIKRDLEYISHHWQKPTVDVWEEAHGDHFYTRMVQRRALLEGADFAASENDSGEEWYRSQGLAVEASLNDFVEGDILLPTVNPIKGPLKTAKVDSVVLLGLLHGLRPGEVIHLKNGVDLSISSPIVVNLVRRMKQTFKELYAINQREGVPGIAIGRYPEDVYSGNGFSGGNPWILTTLAVAEWHFLRAAELSKLGDHEAARAEILEGDAYVARVKYHKNADGSTSEQIHREFGHMVGARQLTWNCAAFLTTSHALNEALSSSR